MHQLTNIAGFICNEGQAAADSKQLTYTGLSIVAVVLLLKLAELIPKQKPLRKFVWWTVLVLGVLLVIAVFWIGPFFYSSWGCRDLLRFVFPNDF